MNDKENLAYLKRCDYKGNTVIGQETADDRLKGVCNILVPLVFFIFRLKGWQKRA